MYVGRGALLFVTYLATIALCRTSNGAEYAISDRLLLDSTGMSSVNSNQYLHFLGSSDGSASAGMCLSPSHARMAADAITAPCMRGQCYTLSTSLRLSKKNFEGTLVHLKNMNTSMGGELRIHFVKSFQLRVYYQDDDTKAEMFERFYYGFRRNHWLQLHIVVCHGSITVHVGCKSLFNVQTPHSRCPVAGDTLKLCVGKTVTDTSPIQADVRNMVILGGDQTGQLCPLSVGKDVLLRDINGLRQQIRTLQDQLIYAKADLAAEHSNHLSEISVASRCKTQAAELFGEVKKAQQQISTITSDYDTTSSRLNQCRTAVKNITCMVNNTIYQIGAIIPLRTCQICTCVVDGRVECVDEPCTPIVPGTESLTCPYGRVIPRNVTSGVCCDTCQYVPGACRYRNKFYEHGSVFKNLDGGVCSPNCSCQNHKKVCPTEACEQLPCQPAQRYTPVGQCCPRCTEEENPCEANPSPCARHQGDAPWTCVNRGGRAECICYFIPSGGGCYTGQGRK